MRALNRIAISIPDSISSYLVACLICCCSFNFNDVFKFALSATNRCFTVCDKVADWVVFNGFEQVVVQFSKDSERQKVHEHVKDIVLQKKHQDADALRQNEQYDLKEVYHKGKGPVDKLPRVVCRVLHHLHGSFNLVFLTNVQEKATNEASDNDTHVWWWYVKGALVFFRI